jgi:hypothetical protein
MSPGGPGLRTSSNRGSVVKVTYKSGGVGALPDSGTRNVEGLVRRLVSMRSAASVVAACRHPRAVLRRTWIRPTTKVCTKAEDQ